VNRTNIREFLQELAREPHVAGQARDEWLAQWVADQWTEAGLDSVRLESYSVLLDYPDPAQPNLVRVLGPTGEELFRSQHREEGVDDDKLIDIFNAYSLNGRAEGAPIYTNYGRVEDFRYLLDSQGSQFTKDRICLARYGKIYRGNKAENAAAAGCSGLVIFMDPSVVAMEGTEPEDLYPNTFWMPGGAVQRGSLALADGDPQTPSWPSVEYAYRLGEVERSEFLPSIPVQPVGYSDAWQLLSRLEGEAAPDSWQGGLNITYRLGGGLVGGGSVTVEVHNQQEERVTSNAVGIIWGGEEPDRYVMLGNHRDAWGYGAVDPNSGTAQMLEVARVLGEAVRTGWRPRRTIMFLSWGGEEYSLMGSREWVEQREQELAQRGVAYINTDVCMSGPVLNPVASPTLMDLYLPAVRDIASPENEEESYYDWWRRWAGQEEDWRPEVEPFVGAGSDHASFLFYAGLPVMDIMFEEDSKRYPNMSGYPAYHTGFETFELVDRIYDPEFRVFAACAQLNLRLGLQLAESEKLPLRTENYADIMEEGIAGIVLHFVLNCRYTWPQCWRRAGCWPGSTSSVWTPSTGTAPCSPSAPPLPASTCGPPLPSRAPR